MSQVDAKAVLERAKKALNLKTDRELSEAIYVPRETIASWKSRGSIPAKYLSHIASTGLSIDWLLTGNGNVFSSDNLGLPHDDEYSLDVEAIWIALNLMARELRSDPNEGIRKFADQIGRRECLSMYFSIDKFYSLAMKSKNTWLKSNLIKKEDVFNALVVEFDLGDWDLHSPPWWEDEELI